jgi:predicted DNA-binding WGR domain protein
MIRMECTRGGSNKYYELHLSETNNRVTVKGFYGAIGQAPKEHAIYDGDNREAAIAEMQKKQLEKQKKGYLIVGGNGSNTITQEKKTVNSR